MSNRTFAVTLDGSQITSQMVTDLSGTLPAGSIVYIDYYSGMTKFKIVYDPVYVASNVGSVVGITVEDVSISAGTDASIEIRVKGSYERNILINAATPAYESAGGTMDATAATNIDLNLSAREFYLY